MGTYSLNGGDSNQLPSTLLIERFGNKWWSIISDKLQSEKKKATDFEIVYNSIKNAIQSTSGTKLSSAISELSTKELLRKCYNNLNSFNIF